MQPTIWHNPSCSKSRATLKLLTDHGFDPEIRLYLNESPQAEELSQLWDLLGPSCLELVRKKEPLFKEQRINLNEASKDEIISMLTAYPKVIERPVVLFQNRAVIARPPERVLDLLSIEK